MNDNREIIVLNGEQIDELVRCKDCKWYYENGAFCDYWADVCEHAEVYPRITP